jgi:hypothetical protein
MFVALLLSLPTGRSTVRMRVWRSLTTRAAAAEGRRLPAPAGAAQAAVFAQAEAEVRAAGGFAMTVELQATSPAQLEHLRGLFDRGKEYGALVKKLAAARGGLARSAGARPTPGGEAAPRLPGARGERLFSGRSAAAGRAGSAALESDASGLLAPGEPRPGKAGCAASTRRATVAGSGRRAATVGGPPGERLADPAVHRPAARFLGSSGHDSGRRLPSASTSTARSSATSGVASPSKCAAQLRPRARPALVSIGHAVHYLDAGGIPVAEAKGLETC